MRLSGCDFFGCLSRSKKLFIRVPTALSSRKLATTPSHRRGKARLNNAIIHYRNLHQIESKRGPWHASAAARRRIMKMGSQAIVRKLWYLYSGHKLELFVLKSPLLQPNNWFKVLRKLAEIHARNE